MLADLLDSVDRRHAFLQQQTDPAAFVAELTSFLRFLDETPLAAAIIADIELDAMQRLEVFRLAEKSCVDRLVALREHLVTIAPALDDSDFVPVGGAEESERYERSLARFDHEVRCSPVVEWPIDQQTEVRHVRPPELFPILEAKQKAASFPADEKASFGERLRDIGVQYDHAHRCFQLELRLHAGVACFRIRSAARYLNPASWADVLATMVGVKGIARHVFEDAHPLDPLRVGTLDSRHAANASPYFREYADLLRAAAQRLHEDFRSRLGGVRSRLALLQRFQERCQLHDAARLRKLVKRPEHRPEDRLRDELALWLFDQGLDPMTEPTLARLRPDILEPSKTHSLYVEAKQYNSREGAKKAFRRGARQVWNTANRMHGKARQLREVFLVVFRLGGPDCHLPPLPIVSNGLSLYAVVIDIAPANKSGSKMSDPVVEISTDDLLPRTDRSRAPQSGLTRRSRRSRK